MSKKFIIFLFTLSGCVLETVRMQAQNGWYFGDKLKCEDLFSHQLQVNEKQKKTLESSNTKLLTNSFQHCGVTVLENIFPSSIMDNLLDELRKALRKQINSRLNIRKEMINSIRSKSHPSNAFTLNSSLLCEPYLQGSQWLRERTDGRIDIDLSSLSSQLDLVNITINQYYLEVLRNLLGNSMELKSTHVMYALSAADQGFPDLYNIRKPKKIRKRVKGCNDQHWHRDDSLLFADNEDSFKLTTVDAHKKSTGLHLPPYAINVFIPLVDVEEEQGPTEFTLGSHMWGSEWADDEEEDVERYGALRDRKVTVKKGSVVLADYRTIHRGTANVSPTARPVLMLIYGRKWWEDRTNYEEDDGMFLDDEIFELSPYVKRIMEEQTCLNEMKEAILESVDDGTDENIELIKEGTVRKRSYEGIYKRFISLALKWEPLISDHLTFES